MEWNPAVWVSESRHFVTDVRSEFRKITWPTQKEASVGTLGVIVIVGIITAVLALIDMVLGWGVRNLLPG